MSADFKTEKHSSLFNTGRWAPVGTLLPAVCRVVPLLYSGPLENDGGKWQEVKAA